jgi:hypothetical protein
MHHRYQKKEKRSEYLARSHEIIIMLLFALAVINATLGFGLALAWTYYKLWVPVAVGVVLVYWFLAGLKFMRDKNNKDANEEELAAAKFSQELSNLTANNSNEPPAYGANANGQYANTVPNASMGHQHSGETAYQGVPIPRSY